MGHLNTNLFRKHEQQQGLIIRLTFSVTEKDIGRSHVPAPVLINSRNVRLTRVRVVEQPIAISLEHRERVVGSLDVHRIIWIRGLVIPQLGTILPWPRVLQKPDEFSSRGVESAEGEDIREYHYPHRFRMRYRNRLRQWRS